MVVWRQHQALFGAAGRLSRGGEEGELVLSRGGCEEGEGGAEQVQRLRRLLQARPALPHLLLVERNTEGNRENKKITEKICERNAWRKERSKIEIRDQ